jgi:hypothetical protein
MQTGNEIHPTSLLRCEAGYSPPFKGKLGMCGAILPLIHTSSCHGVHSEILIASLDKSGCTHVSNLHVKTLKFSINRNYSNLIFINIKNFAY